MRLRLRKLFRPCRRGWAGPRLEVQAIADDEFVRHGFHEVFDGMDGVADGLRRTGDNADPVKTRPACVVKAIADMDCGKWGCGMKAGDGFVSARCVAKLQDVFGGRHGDIPALCRWFYLRIRRSRYDVPGSCQVMC